VNWNIGFPVTGTCQEEATIARKSLHSAHMFKNLKGEC